MNSSDPFCDGNVTRDSLDPFEWRIEQDDTKISEGAAGVVTSVICLLLMLVGLPWNALVIAIIIKKHLYKQPALMVMLNLAIANFLTLLLVVPFNIVVGFTGEYSFGDNDQVRCQVCQTGILLTLFSAAALHFLGLMAIDRLLYLKKPLAYQRIVTPVRMFIAIIVVWILCTAMSILPLVGFGSIVFSFQLSTCIMSSHGNSRLAPNFYYTSLVVLESAIPFLTQFVAYIWILIITRKYLLRKLRRRMRSSNTVHS